MCEWPLPVRVEAACHKQLALAAEERALALRRQVYSAAMPSVWFAHVVLFPLRPLIAWAPCLSLLAFTLKLDHVSPTPLLTPLHCGSDPCVCVQAVEWEWRTVMAPPALLCLCLTLDAALSLLCVWRVRQARAPLPCHGIHQASEPAL